MGSTKEGLCEHVHESSAILCLEPAKCLQTREQTEKPPVVLVQPGDGG